jgi:hypothetical protein
MRVDVPVAEAATLIGLADARRHFAWRQWSELCAAAPPFASPVFFTLDRENIPGGVALVAAAWREGALVGVLPLISVGDELRALRSRELGGLGYDYFGKPGGLASIWRALRSDTSWKRIVLDDVRSDSLLATRLVELARRGGCPVSVRPGEWRSLLALRDFSSRVPEVAERLRRMAHETCAQHQRLLSPRRADLDEALTIAAGRSLRLQHLYHAVVRLFGRQGRAALHFAVIADRRVATMISIEDQRSLHVVELAQRPSVSTLGADELLLWMAARDAARRGLAEISLGDRRALATGMRAHVSLVIYRRSPRGFVAFARNEIAPRLQRAAAWPLNLVTRERNRS